MEFATIEDWVADPAWTAFSPERRDPEMTYLGLRCRCGSDVFRLAGWPRAALGRGGYFWRTLVRVWREARQPMADGEPLLSPFLLPLRLRCDRCDRDGTLFANRGLEDGLSADGSQPRESYRCRACRRGRVELVIGLTLGGGEGGGEGEGGDGSSAVEVVARCRACHRQARVAWADARPSPQKRRLDQLYGRR